MRMTTAYPAVDEALAVARGHIYAFLSAALADPVRNHFEIALDRRVQTVVVVAGELLGSEAPEEIDLGPGERAPQKLDLLPVVEALQKPRNEIARQHQDLFGLLIGKTAPPYETEYCHQTLTFYRAQQLADIAGFYRAFGLEQSREEAERQDHISVELEFMAHLIEKQLFASACSEPPLREKAAVCWEAQKKFFEAHLVWWVPAFAELLRRESAGGLYAAIAQALACLIPCERAILQIRPGHELAEPKSEPEPAGENHCCGAMPCE